jgi:hypothetical protein
VIEKSGAWIPSRGGKVIVNVVCRKAQDRIGVVRVERDLGPVLRFRGGIGSTGPDTAIRLRDVEAPSVVNLPCPACGLMPIDIGALRSTAKQAVRSPKPLKVTL